MVTRANVAQTSDNPKWKYQSAVRTTAMPPNAKYLMFVLLTYLDGTNGLELGRFSPSTRELARVTGLARNTVDKYIRLLIEHGWVAREFQGRKPRYTLRYGRPFAEGPGGMAQSVEPSMAQPVGHRRLSQCAIDGSSETPLPAETPGKDRKTGKAVKDQRTSCAVGSAKAVEHDVEETPRRGRRAGWGQQVTSLDNSPGPATTITPAPDDSPAPVGPKYPDYGMADVDGLNELMTGFRRAKGVEEKPIDPAFEKLYRDLMTGSEP